MRVTATILFLTLALSLGAQEAQPAAPDPDKKIADLTLGDLKALMNLQSVEMQKAHYIKSAALKSFFIPGLGQFQTGDPWGGSLRLAAQITIVAGAAYGSYTLMPNEFKASGLTRDQRRDLMSTYMHDSGKIGQILPSMGIMAGGITLALINSFWSSSDAEDQARARIAEGKVTFEPHGFGMRMAW